LLDGSPEVVGLFANNPFPDRPARQVRLVLYQYRFTDGRSRGDEQAWWTKDLMATSLPISARPHWRNGPEDARAPEQAASRTPCSADLRAWQRQN
jgi:hypothetical protein